MRPALRGEALRDYDRRHRQIVQKIQHHRLTQRRIAEAINRQTSTVNLFLRGKLVSRLCLEQVEVYLRAMGFLGERRGRGQDGRPPTAMVR